jgi:hypothetical protein
VKIIGKEKMIGSPMVQEWMEEGELRAERAYVSRILRFRFDPTLTDDLAASLESVADRAVLDSLLDCALTCLNIDEFRAALSRASSREKMRESPIAQR